MYRLSLNTTQILTNIFKYHFLNKRQQIVKENKEEYDELSLK